MKHIYALKNKHTFHISEVRLMTEIEAMASNDLLTRQYPWQWELLRLADFNALQVVNSLGG
jgi:hypothetical protein